MDTIEFTAINTFIYNKTLSNGLTGDEIVTVINPLLTVLHKHLSLYSFTYKIFDFKSMALAVNRDREPMLPLISAGYFYQKLLILNFQIFYLIAAINEIFHKPTTAFWTGKAMDLLFNGYEVDCTSEDFNSKAACSVFDSGDVKAVFPKGEEEDMFLFALLGRVVFITLKWKALIKSIVEQANGTPAGRFKTYRGVKNVHDLGSVIEFNEEEMLDVWDGDECNEIRGTESSIFPPFMTKEQGIWAFEAGICRSMKAEYDRPTKYRGIPTLRYHLDLGDIAVSV